MAKLPAIRGERVVRALERAGFQRRRQRGSHVSLAKAGIRRPVVVPIHNQDLPRGTLAGILKSAGLTLEAFLELLD